MIRDRLNSYASSFPTPGIPATTAASPSFLNGAQGFQNDRPPAAGDSSAVSGEAFQPEDVSGVSSLLQGLQSWGAPEGGAETGPAGGPQPAAGTTQASPPQTPPSQVPIDLLRQVLNTEKTAGGQASVGALTSLLSWGLSEKEKSGKIRPEFQEILHEAIDFAKEKRMMDEQHLSDYESRLFSQEAEKDSGSDKSGRGKGDGCGCSKIRSIRDSIAAAAA